MTKLDTLIQVETPEAIDIQLRPASLYRRIWAFSIDLVIRVVWFIVSTMILLNMAGDAISLMFNDKFTNVLYVILGVIFINLFVTTWLYSVLFEVFNKGRTWGKMITKIRVVHEDGSPVTWSASMLRNLLRVFDGLPILYSIGMVSMLLTEKCQRTGDLFAGTLVIEDKIDKTIGNMDYLNQLEVVIPITALTREEQYSIVSFAERHKQISKARQEELAEQLCYDLQLTSTNPVNTVLGMGKYYLGQQKDGS